MSFFVPRAGEAVTDLVRTEEGAFLLAIVASGGAEVAVILGGAGPIPLFGESGILIGRSPTWLEGDGFLPPVIGQGYSELIRVDGLKGTSTPLNAVCVPSAFY
jgi:hypothetical protein